MIVRIYNYSSTWPPYETSRCEITRSISMGLRDLGYILHANDAVGREEILRVLDAGAQSMSTNDVALAMSL